MSSHLAYPSPGDIEVNTSPCFLGTEAKIKIIKNSSGSRHTVGKNMPAWHVGMEQSVWGMEGTGRGQHKTGWSSEWGVEGTGRGAA